MFKPFLNILSTDIFISFFFFLYKKPTYNRAYLEFVMFYMLFIMLSY